MTFLDLHSEITLIVKQRGKTFEYYFPKVESARLNIDAEYPDNYWNYPLAIKGIDAYNVDLQFRAVPDGDHIYVMKTDPPLVSRRHPPKKRVRNAY